MYEDVGNTRKYHLVWILLYYIRILNGMYSYYNGLPIFSSLVMFDCPKAFADAIETE